MKKRVLNWVFGVLVLTTIATSCKKDKVEDNEEEVITTMILTFVPVGGGSILTYTYDDADGPGGAAPTQDQIVLAPSKTYGVTVQLLNKTETPVANITTEILSEAEAHRFYYIPTAGSNITVSGFDNDVNGVPLGVTSTWTTGAAATGSINITLRHYPATPPNKEAGDLVNSTKSGTDVEVNFATKIQ